MQQCSAELTTAIVSLKMDHLSKSRPGQLLISETLLTVMMRIHDLTNQKTKTNTMTNTDTNTNTNTNTNTKMDHLRSRPTSN